MKGQQFFHRFQFNDYAVFDNEVDSIGSIELDAVVDDRESHLMCEGNAVFGELITETRVIGAFETTGSKGGMYFESSSENLFRDRSVQPQLNSSVSSVSSVVASFML